MLIWWLEVHLCSMGRLYIVMLITWTSRSFVRWSTSRACSLTCHWLLISLCFGLNLAYVRGGMTVVHLTNSVVRGIGLLMETWGIDLHMRWWGYLLWLSSWRTLGLSSNHVWHLDRAISERWENWFRMRILLLPILMSRYCSQRVTISNYHTVIIPKLLVSMSWGISLVRLFHMGMLLARIQSVGILMQISMGSRLCNTAIFAVAIVWRRYVLSAGRGYAHDSCVIVQTILANGLTIWSSRLHTIICLLRRWSRPTVASRSRVTGSILGVNRLLLATCSSAWSVVVPRHIRITCPVRSHLARFYRLIVMIILCNMALSTLVSAGSTTLRCRIFVDKIVITGRITTSV
mgnify:CR=1 FL=1